MVIRIGATVHASSTEDQMNRTLTACAAAALLAGAPVTPAAAQTADVHLDCIARYALVEWVNPEFMELAYERALVPLAALGPGDHYDAFAARAEARGIRMTDVSTDAEEAQEDAALLAEVHACDALYGFAPMQLVRAD